MRLADHRMSHFTGMLAILLCIHSILTADLPPDGFDHSDPQVYSPLIQKLKHDGFSEEFLNQFYSTSDTRFYERLTRVNLLHREQADPYDKMKNPEAIAAIRNFTISHQDFLQQIESRFEVDRHVIAAILYVESRFGKSSGKHPVLYTLSSMTLAPEDWSIRSLIERMDSLFPDLSGIERERKLTWIKDRAESKATWAYSELTTLLELKQSRGLDINSLKGSWAGAFGIPQFLPSSYAAYGVDGNGDGSVDLYTMKDALASVANYLHENGWRSHGISQERKRRAIWSYNHSKYYVDLITYLAEEASGT